MVLKLDSIWLSIFADLAISLAAAFYALVIIAPNFSNLELPFRLILLIVDLFSGTLFLVLAHWLRGQAKKYD